MNNAAIYAGMRIDTQATRDVVPDEFTADMVAQLPLARLGQTEDLMGTVGEAPEPG